MKNESACTTDGQKLHQNKSTSMHFPYTKTLTHLTSKENSLKRLNIFKIKLSGYVFKNSSILFFLAQLSINPGAALQGSIQRHSSACHVDYQQQQIEQHFHDLLFPVLYSSF